MRFVFQRLVANNYSKKNEREEEGEKSPKKGRKTVEHSLHHHLSL